MSLRRKMLVILGMTMLGMLVLIYAVAQNLHPDAMLYMLLSLALAGFAGTGAALLMLERFVVRRVGRLRAAVSDVESGASVCIAVEGDDEIAELAKEINGMLARLSDAEGELREARDLLGSRVEERTAELRSSEKRYKALVEGMADAVFSIDLDGRINFVNLRTEMLTGRTRTELLNETYAGIFSSGGVDKIADYLDADEDPDMTWRLQVEVLRAGGPPVPVELHCSPVLGSDRRIIGMQLIAHDITDRKRVEAQLMHLASHDHLTSLFNRRRFEEELAVQVSHAQRSGRPGAVLWLDIDNFKDINDSLGHHAGDEVLVALAGMLRQLVRADSVLARLGGDEFAILMADIDPSSVARAAERILNDINSRTLAIEGHAINVGASMGVVLFPEHGTNPDELLAKADVAMYFAKESGRGRLHIHEPDEAWHLELSSRLSWNERITWALKEDALLVYAQPLLDLSDRSINRYELLVRLEGDNGEVIPPNDFLPAAERLGLIQNIDRWMVMNAIHLLETHEDSVRLDVNLSGKAFSDPAFLPLIEGELARSGIDPARLGLEITETAAISDIARAQEFIGRLKALGCRFALDDFGSGFSSFYYLKHLPIDSLKIDGAFVRGLAHSEQDQHLVRALVELCRGLSMQATAEFVEDEVTLTALEELGVDFAQGYHISRPKPVEDMLADRTRDIAAGSRKRSAHRVARRGPHA